MQMMAHSKELVELSRMKRESSRLDDFGQSYDQRLMMVRTHFWVIYSWGQHYRCVGDVLYLSLKVGKPNSLQLVPAEGGRWVLIDVGRWVPVLYGIYNY